MPVIFTYSFHIGAAFFVDCIYRKELFLVDVCKYYSSFLLSKFRLLYLEFWRLLYRLQNLANLRYSEGIRCDSQHLLLNFIFDSFVNTFPRGMNIIRVNELVFISVEKLQKLMASVL